MPVIRRKPDAPDLDQYEQLVTDLAAELTRTDGFGQPMVAEDELPRAGMFEASVFWDRWHGVPDHHRPAIIQQAYRRAGRTDVDKLAFAAGYTIPEAVEAGLLTFQVRPFDMPDGGSTLGARDQALLEVGGSTLRRHGGGQPELWCSSADEAVRYREELIRRVPNSQSLWQIIRSTY